MTALAYRRRRATLEELVAEAIRIVHEDGEPIRIAVPRTLDAMVPDDEAALELIRVGLQTKVNERINTWVPDDEVADRNGASNPEPGRRVTGSPKPSRIDIGLALLARRNYEGADGQRKFFMDFSLADCVNLAKIAESRAHGYEMLAKAASSAAKLLRTRGVATVADLPEEDRKKIGLFLVAAPEDKS